MIAIAEACPLSICDGSGTTEKAVYDCAESGNMNTNHVDDYEKVNCPCQHES